MGGYGNNGYLPQQHPNQIQPQPIAPLHRENPQPLQPHHMQPGQMQPGQLQPGQLQPGQMQPGQLQPGQMQNPIQHPQLQQMQQHSMPNMMPPYNPALETRTLDRNVASLERNFDRALTIDRSIMFDPRTQNMVTDRHPIIGGRNQFYYLVNNKVLETGLHKIVTVQPKDSLNYELILFQST